MPDAKLDDGAECVQTGRIHNVQVPTLTVPGFVCAVPAGSPLVAWLSIAQPTCRRG